MRLFAKIFILFLCCLLLQYSDANGNDSLKNRLSTANANEKARLCNQLAYEYLPSAPDSGRKYALLALETARDHSLAKDEAQALFSIGYSYEVEEDYLKALDYYNQSFERYSALNDLNGVASVANYIGTIYKYTGHYETALQYYNTALKHYIALNDQTGLSYTYNNIGVVHFNTGQYEKAGETYRKCLNYAIETHDSLSIASVYNNLGLLAVAQHQYAKAQQLYEKSLEICSQTNDYTGMATAYSNIADIFIIQKKYEKALNYLDMVEAINPVEFSGTIRANSFLNQAVIYEKLGDKQKAEDYFKKSIELSLHLNLRPILASASYDYARFLVQQNRHQEANACLMDVIALRDSIHTENLARQIANTNFNIQLNEKKIENDALREQNEIDQVRMEKWKWILVLAISAALIILLMLLYIFKRFRHASAQKNQLQARNDEIVKLNKELTLLRDQLHGHLKEKTRALTDEQARRAGIEKDLADIRHEHEKTHLVSAMLRRHVTEEIESAVDLIRDTGAHIAGQTDNLEWKTLLDHITFNARHIQFSLQELMILDGDRRSWTNARQGKFEAVRLLAESEKYFSRLIPGAKLTTDIEEGIKKECRGDKNTSIRLINDAIILLYRNATTKEVSFKARSEGANLIVSISALMSEDTMAALKRYSDVVAGLHAAASESIDDIDIITPLYYMHVFSELAGASYQLSTSGEKMMISFGFPFAEQQVTTTLRSYSFAIAGNEDPINNVLLTRNLIPLGRVDTDDYHAFLDRCASEQHPHFDAVFIDIATDQVREFCDQVEIVKNAFPTTLLVAMSAYLLPEDRNRLLNAGFHFCLAKPISNHALQRIIENIVR